VTSHDYMVEIVDQAVIKAQLIESVKKASLLALYTTSFVFPLNVTKNSRI